MMNRLTFPLLVLVAWGFGLSPVTAEQKLLLLAGRPSHPPRMHEFRAGCLLLEKCLADVPGLTTMVYSNGWPQDESVFDGVAAVIMYADGGGGHPALQGERLKFLDGLIKKGVGFGVMHYGCEVPADKAGKEFLDWVGGYYEHQFSCNPMWSPDFQSFPNHPSTRGVKPFSIKDEWYFNMRFREGMKGITPILVAKPSDDVRDGPYVWPQGPYDHIKAASGRDEIMMWAVEQPSGARCFGFTGGHFHDNWADDNFRKVVLNALIWAAKVDVPANGVISKVTPTDLDQNLDPKRKR